MQVRKLAAIMFADIMGYPSSPAHPVNQHGAPFASTDK
jgi:hypothetical protein